MKGFMVVLLLLLLMSCEIVNESDVPDNIQICVLIDIDSSERYEMRSQDGNLYVFYGCPLEDHYPSQGNCYRMNLTKFEWIEYLPKYNYD